MVNIILYVIRDSLDGKSIAAFSKKEKAAIDFKITHLKEDIWKKWCERRDYLFILKAALVFPILTGRVEKGWVTLC